MHSDLHLYCPDQWVDVCISLGFPERIGFFDHPADRRMRLAPAPGIDHPGEPAASYPVPNIRFASR
jgi:hypothetical protein